MANDVAIRVDDLGKCYRLGERGTSYRTLREAIMGIGGALRRRANRADTIWALKDIDLEVRHGEVLGIIGHNGAGKTTLLKVLSRITEPTTGRVELYGRVGSLLEVGTGFHPELTGRENIYLNGAILGMRKAEIQRKFDEIVAFAEVERFLDTPVKHYSSGMYVRLAFAVAAHLEPEILLVDEVLSVGDAAFQRKCLGKMGEVAGEGRTVLFVSHNMGAVRALCDRVAVLWDGKVRLESDPPTAISVYLESFSTPKTQTRVVSLAGGAIVLNQFLVTASGSAPEVFTNDCAVDVRLRIAVRKEIANLSVGFTLVSALGSVVLSSCHADSVHSMGQTQTRFLPGDYEFHSTIPPLLMNEGTYFIGPVLQDPGKEIFIDEPFWCRFSVARRTPKTGAGKRPGSLLVYLPWSISKVE